MRERAALERALHDAANTVPAGSILIVRRISVPNPARAGHAAIAANVERALVAAAASAAHPARSFVPAAAEAVFFADASEMLCCLARDWMRGAIEACWWWREIVRAGTDASAMVRLWLDHVVAAPAALDALDRSADLAPFVRALDARSASELYRAMLVMHGLAEIVAVESGELRGSDHLDVFTAARASRTSTPAPWIDLGLDASTLALPASLQLIAGVACALCRSPAVARSAPFAHALAAWTATSDSHARDTMQPIAQTAMPASAAHAVPAAPSPGQLIEAREDPSRRTATSDPHAALPARLTAPTATPLVLPVLEPPTAESARHQRAAEESPSREVADGGSRATSSDTVFYPQNAASLLDTRFGGVLFLLNVALALDLYGDFTQPMHRGLRVSPWVWLGAMGERLAGRAFRGDPLPGLLKTLAGPDAGFRVARRGHAEMREPPWPRELPRVIAVRLMQALALARLSHVRRVLFARPARIAVTPTTLTATFALATHPVAIRFAGLDRDPGWIPAAGRDVRFCFE
jgi:hypothetical protein